VVSVLTAHESFATAFDISVTPPRFEKKTKPGRIVRDVVRIRNLDAQSGRYIIKTADWDFDGQKVTFNEGKPHRASCRPWVRIERHSVIVPPGAVKAYRFEIHVPADAPATECRFALLISPDPKSVKPLQLGQIRFPVVGRVAVIVYVRVGSAKPELQYRGLEWREYSGRKLPAVVMENVGNAHGRPFGSFRAVDAAGRKVELLVDESPILPGQTRAIVLRPAPDPRAAATSFGLQRPLRIRGRIEWDGGSRRLDQTLR
jgi:hypothetical protein